MFLFNKRLLSAVRHKTSLVLALALIAPCTMVKAEEFVVIEEEPRLNQNLIVGSVAIALVGAGVAVALSGNSGGRSSGSCSSCLYSYSGGLNNWSSSSEYSYYGSSSSTSSSSSSSSHHEKSAPVQGIRAGEAFVFSVESPAPESIDFVFINHSSYGSTGIEVSPLGTSTQVHVPEHSSANLLHGNTAGSAGPVSEGNYSLILNTDSEAPSGESIGTILVSIPGNGAVVSSIEVFAP
jgi:hypothetical protein